MAPKRAAIPMLHFRDRRTTWSGEHHIDFVSLPVWIGMRQISKDVNAPIAFYAANGLINSVEGLDLTRVGKRPTRHMDYAHLKLPFLEDFRPCATKRNNDQ